jgi:glyoxylase-like metal-dependent hydrolase (beta-lactamase superfamily II)
MSPPVLKCHILDTGYCLASEHLLLEGGRRQTIHVYSLAALLHHPAHGWLAWDTGYARRMLAATRGWPHGLYRLLTPLPPQPDRALVSQLPRWGLTPGDVRYILISHFHADHVSGLRDFPAARFVVRRDAYAAAAPLRGLQAVRRAYIPALLPEDFVQRATLLADFTGPPLPGLGPPHDLFDDGSLLLVHLPGHARGQMGLLANTERGPILFAADGAMFSAAIRELRPPAPLTHFFADDALAMLDTLNRLNIFAAARPDVRLAPTHCPEAREMVSG